MLNKNTYKNVFHENNDYLAYTASASQLILWQAYIRK